MDDPKPIPCPFCGTTPKVRQTREATEIVCFAIRCKVQPCTFTFATYAEAVKAWNKRKEVQR